MNSEINKYPLHQVIRETYSDSNFEIDERFYKLITPERVNEKDDKNKTPLYWAIYKDNVRIVEPLLKAKADINSDSYLIQAIKKQSIDIVKKLIEHKAEVDVKDHNECTALYWAMRYDRIETRQEVEERLKEERERRKLEKKAENIEFHLETKEIKEPQPKDCIKFTRTLLENGANSNLVGYDNSPPLNTAVLIGNIDLVRLLLDYKADPTIEDKYGNSAYSIALTNNLIAILQLIMEHPSTGPNWIHKSYSILNYKMPLFYAVDLDDLDTVKLLLENGADPKKKDRHGYSLYTNNIEIHKLLHKK